MCRFDTLTEECFAEFSSGGESKEAFGPNGTWTYTKGLSKLEYVVRPSLRVIAICRTHGGCAKNRSSSVSSTGQRLAQGLLYVGQRTPFSQIALHPPGLCSILDLQWSLRFRPIVRHWRLCRRAAHGPSGGKANRELSQTKFMD